VMGAPPAAPLPPAGAISIFALIPSEFLGLPIVAWIGIALWLPIMALLFIPG